MQSYNWFWFGFGLAIVSGLGLIATAVIISSTGHSVFDLAGGYLTFSGILFVIGILVMLYGSAPHRDMR